VERRQGKPNGRDDESRRVEVTTAVDVSRPTDDIREVRRGGAVQTTVRQNTEAEANIWPPTATLDPVDCTMSAT